MKRQIDRTYQLTNRDWNKVKKAAETARGNAQKYLRKLLRRKHLQFPSGRGSDVDAINRHLKKVELPFVLRAPDYYGAYFTDRKYRLYKVLSE